jgi:ketosteroid isomerase-like protein
VGDELGRNRALARSLWQAATAGDPSPMLAFDPDVVWRAMGTGPMSGEFRGIDAVLHYLARVAQTADEIRSELIDVLASEHAAVIHYINHLRIGARTLEEPFFLWVRIEDGTVTEVTSIPWDQAKVATFWKPH